VPRGTRCAMRLSSRLRQLDTLQLPGAVLPTHGAGPLNARDYVSESPHTSRAGRLALCRCGDRGASPFLLCLRQASTATQRPPQCPADPAEDLGRSDGTEPRGCAELGGFDGGDVGRRKLSSRSSRRARREAFFSSLRMRGPVHTAWRTSHMTYARVPTSNTTKPIPRSTIPIRAKAITKGK
jgi:hypothetical protein